MVLSIITLSLLTGAPATASTVIGDVRVVTDGEESPVRRFLEIPEGATVITGERSRVSLRFASGSLVRVGPESMIVLSELQHRSGIATQRREGVKVSIGRIWASVTSLFGDDSAFRTEGPNVVCGVRGTSYFYIVDDDGERIVLEEGRLAIEQGSGRLDLSGPGRAYDAATREVSQVTVEEIEALKRLTGGYVSVAAQQIEAAGGARRDDATREDQRRRREINGQDDLSDSALTVDDLSDEPAVSGNRADPALDVDVDILPPR
ncbi:MAG: FecR domain-containing protein [Myxococcota bacterium]